MLWHKYWLETRLWFFLAVTMLVAQAFALYMSYPLDPATSYPNGALGVMPHEMDRLRTSDFRAYVWLRWFSTTMLLFWPVYALKLAGTGFEARAGREYLLSLPITRRRVALARLAVVVGELATFTVLPSLLVCALAPLVGQRYPIGDALIHSGILIVGGLGLFGLTMFLRVVTGDAAAYTLAGALVVFFMLATFLAKGLTPYSIFRLMNGADYFFDQQVPWTGLALSAAVGFTMILLSLRVVERRDF